MALILVIAVAAVLIVIRVSLFYADRSRIEDAARTKGWQDVGVTWAPFAPGWFFEKGERHYMVSFTDRDGNRKTRYCKTSLLTGVYWRDEYL